VALFIAIYETVYIDPALCFTCLWLLGFGIHYGDLFVSLFIYLFLLMCIIRYYYKGVFVCTLWQLFAR
jgi:hypothetical protein